MERRGGGVEGVIYQLGEYKEERGQKDGMGVAGRHF